MFAIAPQTLNFHGTVFSFGADGDDVSKCLLKVDDHVFRFHRNGHLIEHTIVQPQTEEPPEALAERAREQAEAAAQAERELKTADDTTAADVAFDAPHQTPVPEITDGG